MIMVGSRDEGEEIESEMEEVKVLYSVVMVEEREEIVSTKDGGVLSFIFFKGGLCMFQVPLWFLGVFFGGKTFPSNKERTV